RSRDFRLQPERGAVDHLAQGEGRVDLGDVWHGRQPLLVDALVIREVLCRDAQYVVVFAGHQMAGQHVRAALDCCFELGECLLDTVSSFAHCPDSEMGTIACIWGPSAALERRAW